MLAYSSRKWSGGIVIMDAVEAIAVGSSEELFWLLIGVPSVLAFLIRTRVLE